MHVKTESSWIKHLDFIIADLLCLNATFVLAYFLRCGIHNVYASKIYRELILITIFLHFCVIFFRNYYSGILKRGYFDEFKKVLFHNVILTALIFSYLFIMQRGSAYSRIVLVSFFLMNTIAMYMIHIILKYVQRKKEVSEVYAQKILVISTPHLVNEAINKIIDGPDKKYQIIGIAFEEEEKGITEVQGIPVVATGEWTYEFARCNVVDEAFIYLDSMEKEKIEKVANRFLLMGVTVHINVDVLASGFPNVHLGHVNSATVVTTSINTVSSADIFLKRLLDICAGIAGCIITGLLYIFLAPAIKIADPDGPVFFGQERVGRNGRTFKIYKFRSMYSDAEERKKGLMDQNKMSGLMFKMDADPRIIGSGPDGTRKGLGHFLRASSLDEFPNFWSILKGDMSLVGTRPPTMDEYEQYALHHKSRLAAKPGLTGMWQVSGRSDFTDFEEVVKLDNEYIKEWSIGLDLKIIFKTIIVVLTRKGSV